MNTSVQYYAMKKHNGDLLSHVMELAFPTVSDAHDLPIRCALNYILHAQYPF